MEVNGHRYELVELNELCIGEEVWLGEDWVMLERDGRPATRKDITEDFPDPMVLDEQFSCYEVDFEKMWVQIPEELADFDEVWSYLGSL